MAFFTLFKNSKWVVSAFDNDPIEEKIRFV